MDRQQYRMLRDLIELRMIFSAQYGTTDFPKNDPWLELLDEELDSLKSWIQIRRRLPAKVDEDVQL